jgi:hypothetical protein
MGRVLNRLVISTMYYVALFSAIPLIMLFHPRRQRELTSDLLPTRKRQENLTATECFRPSLLFMVFHDNPLMRSPILPLIQSWRKPLAARTIAKPIFTELLTGKSAA